MHAVLFEMTRVLWGRLSQGCRRRRFHLIYRGLRKAWHRSAWSRLRTFRHLEDFFREHEAARTRTRWLYVYSPPSTSFDRNKSQ